jgi:hypothetical protein
MAKVLQSRAQQIDSEPSLNTPYSEGQYKAMHHSSKLGAGAKARKHLHGQAKVGVVMHEYKHGTLHSGSGGIVKSRPQAIAIAMHEAGLSKKK